MKGVRYGAEICVCDFWVGLGVGSGNHKIRRPSYPHRHHDIAVLVILAIGGAKLAGGLGVLQLKLHFSGADSFQKIQNILRVEADGERVAVVIGFEGVFGFAAFGGGGGELQFAFLELDTDGAGALVGELGYAGDGGAKVFAVYGVAIAYVFGRVSFVVGELASVRE